MDQKIILLVMCYIPAFLKGFLTYSSQVNSGDNFTQAFQEAFMVFIMLFALGTLVMLMLYPILKSDIYEKHNAKLDNKNSSPQEKFR